MDDPSDDDRRYRGGSREKQEGVSLAALDWLAVAERRTGHWLGSQIVYREHLDSTNTLAAALIPSEAPPGTVVVTDHQTAGKGRLGRRWIASPSAALTFTAVLGPVTLAWAVPMACGLAIGDALASAGLASALKWPNDVLVEGKKCAGILVEARTVDGTPWLLAGIGLNVRDADPALPDATYLDAHAGYLISREDLLAALLAALEGWCERIATDPDAVRETWRARLVTLGQLVSVQTPAGMLEGLAESITREGALQVRDASGTLHDVHAGDVTLAVPRS